MAQDWLGWLAASILLSIFKVKRHIEIVSSKSASQKNCGHRFVISYFFSFFFFSFQVLIFTD